MSDETFDITIFGVTIGTATGWDGDPGTYSYHDFNSIDKSLPIGFLCIEETEEFAEIFDEDNNCLKKFSILDYINKIRGK